MKKPYALIIRDGWGYNTDNIKNAIHHANTPNHDKYLIEYPSALIAASGEQVGLPSANQGSSEVGHLNFGGARVVYQSLVRISRSIDDGSFYSIKTINDAVKMQIKNNKPIHVMGLVQDQGVHAHNNHLKAVIKLCADLGCKSDNLIIHVFSDGRDTPPQSAEKYIKDIEHSINDHKCGVFGSITGRYYAMDRDNRWERVKICYDMLTGGVCDGRFDNIYDALADGYSKGETDEFIKPRVTGEFKQIVDDDLIVFFNYRLDRTRELTKAFVENDFSGFSVKDIKNLKFLCFTEYYEGVKDSSRAKVEVVFEPVSLNGLVGELISKKGMKQLRIAETEKFAHVTFFFNGQSDKVFDGEDRALIPSPKVATYDLEPEMSAFEVKDKAVELINSDKYDFIVLNFANPDMVGHTGNFEAAKKACEVVDQCVGDVVSAILKKDGVVMLTADHGNSEQMIDYNTGGPMTAHTSFMVWCHLISKRVELQKDRIKFKTSGGKLADVTYTLLKIMGIEPVKEMDGQSLIENL